MGKLGKRLWAIPEGYIPADDDGKSRRTVSHETACILNVQDVPARLTLTLYFANREPAGPYRVEVPPRRTLHLRFNDLTDPEPVPRGVDYSSVIESDVPIVVQHTRLDSTTPAKALLTTVAYAEP